MNTDPKYEPNYIDWLRKDISILEDAVYLLLNVEPLKRKSLTHKDQ